MDEKIISNNAFVLKHMQDNDYQTYLIAFDFLDNVIENYLKWEEFLTEHKHDKLKVTIEINND